MISLLWVRFGRSCATKKSNLERGGAFEDEENGEREESMMGAHGGDNGDKGVVEFPKLH